MEMTLRDGILTHGLDWGTYVSVPATQGNYVEAFSVADAFIDGSTSSMLRRLYKGDCCQDLLNEIELVSIQNIRGTTTARILESKTAISGKLMEMIREWKIARNLVCHSSEGHYALIRCKSFDAKMDDVAFQAAARKEADEWLNRGLKIWMALCQAFKELEEKGRDSFFSVEFYKQHPRRKRQRCPIASKFT